MNKTALHQGVVVGQFGRHCLVQDAVTQDRRICHARGKKAEAVVGDQVQWQPSADEGTIEKVLPRRSLLYRQDELRTKTFAANLDLVLMWIAAEPVFSERQLARALVACEAAAIRAVIVLNKLDLSDAAREAWRRLSPYRAMGYEVIGTCLKREDDPGFARVQGLLQGKTTLVLGPSGGGKSSFVNRVIPDAQAATNEISQALNSGKHTTTSTSWYALAQDGSPAAGALIDSPGFQEFGLHHISPSDLAGLMPDIKAHLGACKFYNCTHLHEPQCGVRTAVADADPEPPVATAPPDFDEKPSTCHQDISIRRYALYSELMAELQAANNPHR